MHADELFEMLNSGLAYIRPANVQRLWATTTAATPTLSAHDAALLCLWNAARQVRDADVTCLHGCKSGLLRASRLPGTRVHYVTLKPRVHYVTLNPCVHYVTLKPCVHYVTLKPVCTM